MSTPKPKGSKAKTRSEKPATFIPPGCEAMLSKHQVCALLGVSLSTLQGMVYRKEYPSRSMWAS